MQGVYECKWYLCGKIILLTYQIKKFISANKDEDVRKRLIAKFEKEAVEIVQDPFGNYAIQYAIDTYGPEACEKVLNELTKHIISLSMQKFSSNVVEKCLECVDRVCYFLTFQVNFKKILNDMFSSNNFLTLLKNKYGHFVLQKAITLMNLDEKKEIKEYLTKKVNVSGSKEKTKFNSMLDMMSQL